MRTWHLMALALLGLALSGCGQRQTIEGVVTLDGQPLEQGYINFRPDSGGNGPTLGSPIAQGNYALLAQDHLAQGKYRVEITSLGKLGRRERDDSGNVYEAEGQILPARYNRRSQLQVELAADSSPTFNFDLKSR